MFRQNSASIFQSAFLHLIMKNNFENVFLFNPECDVGVVTTESEDAEDVVQVQVRS